MILLAVLMKCSTTTASAQSADALIDKLVAKGILSVDEAKELRSESDQGFSDAVQSKLGMADWVSSYKISGDFRGRYEHFASDNRAFNLYDRYRYRLRFGMTVNMQDNLELGFRLGSGDPKASGGNPLSQNSTLQGDFSDKNIYIDAAYGRWMPVNYDGLTTVITVGKMDNPFNYTWMVFDPDLTPEGASLRTAWQINDRQAVTLTAATFLLNTAPFNSQFLPPTTVYLYGGQALWNAQWTDKLSTSVGGGGFKIVNSDQLTTANVPLINQGNTRAIVPVNQGGSLVDTYALQAQFAPVILDANATYLLDSFPFYNGQFPLKVGAEFMQNVAANNKNQGMWVGFTLGKAGKKGTWDISYRYEYLEADAWYDQLVDDDNGVFYPGDVPGANAGYGYYGGTNVKGHMIRFNYSFTDSLTLTVTSYLNDMISRDGLVSDVLVPDNKTSQMFHLMADLTWVF